MAEEESIGENIDGRNTSHAKKVRFGSKTINAATIKDIDGISSSRMKSQQVITDNTTTKGTTITNVVDNKIISSDLDQLNNIIVQPTDTKSSDSTSTAQWAQRMANPPANVMEMTLKATTQMQTTPLEMETRSTPRKLRTKRDAAIHTNRVKGRCYSDTFFSTVKSIRNFLCVQLFVYSLSDFIYIKPMNKESQSHSALQDSIRDVGAPQEMFTDNSKTQKGKQWTKTLRPLFVRWIGCASHKQNQNKAEQKIQDIKHRTILTMYNSGAPLVMWCFCIKFVADCLNHTAKKKL